MTGIAGRGRRKADPDRQKADTGHRGGTHRQSRTDEGSSVVEAVLVVPVLMLVLMVIVQFCLWMHATQVAQTAASVGDQVARSVGGGPAAGVASARSVLSGTGSDVTGSTVVVSVLPGESEWLQVTGRAVSVVPGLSFAVSASAIGPIQQFRGSE